MTRSGDATQRLDNSPRLGNPGGGPGRRATQSYFDELVRENAEEFGLSPEEAVQEAIHQLECGGAQFDHLVLTAPAGTGSEADGAKVDGEEDVERRERAEFNNSLHCLRLWTKSTNDAVASNDDDDDDDDDDDEEEEEEGDEGGRRHGEGTSREGSRSLEDHLSIVDACLAKDGGTYSKLWDASGGWSVYVGLLAKEAATAALSSSPPPSGRPSSSRSRCILPRILETLCRVLEAPQPPQGPPSPDRLRALQQCFGADVMRAWLILFDSECRRAAEEGAAPTGRGLLTVAYWSCKRSEAQKQRWMEQRLDNSQSSGSIGLVDVVLDVLSRISSASDESNQLPLLLFGPLCRWISVLCRNDFDGSDHDAPLTASATARVQQFTSSGALVPGLHGHLRDAGTVNDHERLVALLQTCRALAIHNDVVLSMSQDGLVGTAIDLFENSSTIASAGNDASLLTALVGLFRNLCANDDVKNLLGRTVLPSLALRFADVAQDRPRTAASTESHLALIEQFCGLVAALSLRHPGNARQLVRRGAVEAIVSGMERYPQSAAVQRSAAYAVRNLVSRWDLNPPLAEENGCDVQHSSKRELQELCQPALVRAARTHASCQEAVYAALRDLGCSDAKMSRVVVDEAGRAKLVACTNAFQPGSNAGFRAVYD